MNFLGISIVWWAIAFLAVMLFPLVRSYKKYKKRVMAQQGSPEMIKVPTRADKSEGKENKTEPGEDEEEDEKPAIPATWDDIQKHVDFGKYFAIGDEDDWTWEARELDLLLEHGWEFFTAKDGALFFKKDGCIFFRKN